MQRQCFYCNDTFQSTHFHNHLKQCPERQKQNNQEYPPPQYNQFNPYNGDMQKQYPPQQNYNMRHYQPHQQMQRSSHSNNYQNNQNDAAHPMYPQYDQMNRGIHPFPNNNAPSKDEVKLQFNSNRSFRSHPHHEPCIDHPVFGGFGPQDPDDASAELIKRMLAEERCILCDKNQGIPLNCGHHLCTRCGKKYIFNGITTLKWKSKPLICPAPDGCEGNIPLSFIKECRLGSTIESKLDTMQNHFTINSLINNDPTITSCPKCAQTYSTEIGDIYTVNTNEKGPDGQLLSYAHRQHKARYRFRCSGNGCRTIFCSGCNAVPYHTGYTCAQYKQYQQSAKCRFCEVTLDATNTAVKDHTLNTGLDAVCSSTECIQKRRRSCDYVHTCGHNCIGLMGHECIPCLNKKCLSKKAAAELTENEFCNICFVDELRAAPCVQLRCGHYFHFSCVLHKIAGKWPSARITFGFLNCPLCKEEIHHPALDAVTKEYYDLKREIERDGLERIKMEGLENDQRLMDPNSQYYNNVSKYAFDRLAFYICSKCAHPYFGGMKECEQADQAERYKKEDLVCGSCASGPNGKSCKKHGKKYITYKCKFCCSVGTWYCWGSTHFCDSCHKIQEGGDYLNRKPISELPKCPGKDKCPLGVEHPPNGEKEFSLGCVVCLRK
eukprot:219972_1